MLHISKCPLCLIHCFHDSQYHFMLSRPVIIEIQINVIKESRKENLQKQNWIVTIIAKAATAAGIIINTTN